MKILIIKNIHHYLSGWYYLAEQLKKMIQESYPKSDVFIMNISYTSWLQTSFYSYSYKNIDIRNNYDLIFVCEGKPPKKWAKNGHIIWIPCQEFLSGGPWSLITSDDNDWFSILSPSNYLVKQIKLKNTKLDVKYMKFWSTYISPKKIKWKEIEKNKNKNKLNLFLHLRTRNWGEDFWTKLLKTITNKINNISFTIKIDNNSNLDLKSINLNHVSRIIGGNVKREKYIEALISSDIYFAPRIIEGIGLCSQEAAQFGNVLIGPNYTTFNEYFSSSNGLIVDIKEYSNYKSKSIMGSQKTIIIDKNQDSVILNYINKLNKNKEKLREIQEYNCQFAEQEYINFRKSLKKYIDECQNVKKIVYNKKKIKIVHLQFCFEGGQGLISSNIAKNLYPKFDNIFYYISDKENPEAIKSYQDRLNPIFNKKINSPKDINNNFDLLFVHWSSPANKRVKNTNEWYKWIKQTNSPTIGFIYDSIHSMPPICDYYSVASKFNCQFVPHNSKGTFIIPYQVEDYFYHQYDSEEYINYKYSPFVIGRMSRLIERKFNKISVPIIKYLQKFNQDISMYVIGDGKFEIEIKKQAQKLNIPFCIKNSMYGEDRAIIMKTFDIFLYLTGEHEESFGLVVAEALALGLPVVCEEKGALSEVVGNAGFVCKSIEEVLNKCQELIQKPNMRKEISKNAKIKSLEYSREKITFKIENMINNIINNKKYYKNNNTPKWSIIMPTYNSSKYIITSILSILDQTEKNWELIIIDDNSSDNTEEKVNKFTYDNRIKYVKYNNGPHWQSWGWNEGYKIAKGKYIGFFDSDDWLNPIALEEMSNYYNNNPEVICAWSNNEQWYPNFRSKRLEQQNFSENPYKYHGSLIEGMIYNHPGVIVSHFLTCKKNAIKLIGGIDTSIKTSADRWIVLEIDLKGKLGFVNKKLHRYRYKRKGSITKSRRLIQISTLENILNNALKKRNYSKKVVINITKDLEYDIKINDY